MTKKKWPTKKHTPPSKGTRRTQAPVRMGRGEIARRQRLVDVEQAIAQIRVTLDTILNQLGMTVMHELERFITNKEDSDPIEEPWREEAEEE